MSRYHIHGHAPCPTEGCEEVIAVDLHVTHDRGCWRTPNGDGWPESWDYDPDHPDTCPAGHPLEGEQWEASLERVFDAGEEPDDYRGRDTVDEDDR